MSILLCLIYAALNRILACLGLGNQGRARRGCAGMCDGVAADAAAQVDSVYPIIMSRLHAVFFAANDVGTGLS